VAIFHGDADTMVPLRHSEELARRVPGSTLSVWPGEGHLGTITHVDDILDRLR
jgi:pimeloyl-ACP methyl ester carboxylesterase